MIKFIKCTATEYSTATKSADNFYYVDNEKFYLGEILLSPQDLSSYLTQVVAADDSIKVTNNNQIAVKISSKTGNNISLVTESGKEGLYVSVPAATNYTVGITETSGSGSDPYSKRYNVVQSATGLNVNIDIPKDMVVESGTVVDITYNNGKLYDGATDVTSKIKGTGTATAADAGKYIKLQIANATSDVIYIAAKDLVDIYTAASGASQVQLAISNDNVISGTLVDSGVSTAKIANNAVTTDKLASAIVTSLGKADSAVQNITTGTNNGTITVDGTEVSVKGLGSAAYTASSAYATSTQGGKADTALQPGSITTGTNNGTIKVNTTEVAVKGLGTAAYTNANAYATAAQGTLASTAVQNISAGATNGSINVDGTTVNITGLKSAAYTNSSDYATAAQGALAASAVQNVTTGANNGTIKVDNVEVSVYGLGTAAYTNANAYATSAQGTKADNSIQSIAQGTNNGEIKYSKDGTNYTAVKVKGLDTAAYAKTTDFDAAGSASTALSTAIGTSSDGASANTIYGAKAYANSILNWTTLS